MGIGVIIWKIAVALYLLATGVLGLQGSVYGAFHGTILGNGILLIVASIIAFIAGLFLLLEMFNIKIAILDTLVLIIAIIWAIFTVLYIVAWVTSGFGWVGLATIGVYIMVLASLLVASKKFG